VRHKINLKSNNFIEYKSKKLKTQDEFSKVFIKMFHNPHPKIQSRYDEELEKFNLLLADSKNNQLRLMLAIEDSISYRYATEKSFRILYKKWSDIFTTKSLNRLTLSDDLLSAAAKDTKSPREQIKRYLYCEIGKGLNSIAKVHKDSKNKEFDCISIEFNQSAYNKKIIDILSLLSDKGIAIFSLPANEYQDVRKSLVNTDFNILALCSSRDTINEGEWDFEIERSSLVNEKFKRPLHNRYIVVVIFRSVFDYEFIGSEFDQNDESYFFEYFDEALNGDNDYTNSIVNSRYKNLTGAGLQIYKNDFYDLENLYNKLEFNELIAQYEQHTKIKIQDVSRKKAADILNVYIFMMELKKPLDKTIVASNDKYSTHDEWLYSIGKKKKEYIRNRIELIADKAEKIKSHPDKEGDIKILSKEIFKEEEEYKIFAEKILSYEPHESLQEINNILIIEWRVDGAGNVQYCGAFVPIDWNITENKYWDPNYYIECIEIDTKIVKTNYLLAFLNTKMGSTLINIAIDELNYFVNEEPELWKHIIIFIPPLSVQSKMVEAMNAVNSLAKTLKKSEQSISSNLENIDEIVDDLNNWQASLGLLNNSSRIEQLLYQGESDFLEFKESLSLDKKTNTKEKYLETSCLKTIAGFLNAKGGTLLIGVSDNGDIIGIYDELKIFYKENLDKILLHLKNLIQSRIGKAFYEFISYKAIKIKGKIIIEVTTKAIKSGNGCYLDENSFYVRRNPGTDELKGKELVKYVQDHFK
jgi:hypothetical protein